MYRLLIAIALLAMGFAASAQEWVEHGGAEYNCDVLRGMLADYGDRDLSRRGDSVTTVGELFAVFFPACPEAIATAASESPSQTDASSSEPLFSFSSDESGMQPVLGPLTLPAGVYVITATTDGYMTVSPQSLSGDCGSDVRRSIFNLSSGEGGDGAQSVVVIESNCNVLLEIGNTRESWSLDIVAAKSLSVQSFSSSYSTDSDTMGLQPALGPLKLPAGVYVFTAKTDGYMIVSPQSLSGDCGSDVRRSIFNLSSGEGADGAQSVVEVEKDCAVLLEIGNTREYWQLEINRLS